MNTFQHLICPTHLRLPYCQVTIQVHVPVMSFINLPQPCQSLNPSMTPILPYIDPHKSIRIAAVSWINHVSFSFGPSASLPSGDRAPHMITPIRVRQPPRFKSGSCCCPVPLDAVQLLLSSLSPPTQRKNRLSQKHYSPHRQFLHGQLLTGFRNEGIEDDFCQSFERLDNTFIRQQCY
jgi:hypothetical protein